MEIVILILSGFLFYFFNELEDECVRNTWRLKCEHLNNWLNHKTSSRNKWSKLPKEQSKKWYYLWIYQPRHKEAFPYSSTLLVWITDGEHFFQLLKILSICGGFLCLGFFHFLFFFCGVLFFAFIKTVFLKKYIQ